MGVGVGVAVGVGVGVAVGVGVGVAVGVGVGVPLTTLKFTVTGFPRTLLELIGVTTKVWGPGAFGVQVYLYGGGGYAVSTTCPSRLNSTLYVAALTPATKV